MEENLKITDNISVSELDALEKALLKRQDWETGAECSKSNIHAAAYRFQKNFENIKRQWAWGWYQGQMEVAQTKSNVQRGTGQRVTDEIVDNEDKNQDAEEPDFEGEWTLVESANENNVYPDVISGGSETARQIQPTEGDLPI